MKRRVRAIYQRSVAEAVRFLSGKFDGILHELEEKMQAASEALEFEKAIEYRELWNSVKKIAQKQKITDSHGEDRDVLAAGKMQLCRSFLYAADA